jgi:alpha-L-fucosidase
MTYHDQPHGDLQWFQHDRFGLFIHWGLYSLGARHEWLKNREEMSDGQYDRYFRAFAPDLYDPEHWAELAAAAGMKYFVITTKHHDGFCLWDTKLTDYKAPNGPAGQDLLRPMVEAFRRRGLRVGLYYSLPDWRHPDFPIDGIHPQRNHPDREQINASRRMSRYADYVQAQIRELLTGYGQIDVLWFDMGQGYRPGVKGRGDWQSERLLTMIRELQPQILVNDRLELIDVYGWDFLTPEQFAVREAPAIGGELVPWETCQTFSGSWGYHRDEMSWKSVDQLVRLLIDTVSKGGNLLLNVGPTGRGEFDHRARERLLGLGEWMRQHSRAIYGCTAVPPDVQCPDGCRLTYSPATRRLYVHVLAWPFRALHLPGMSGKVAYAQLLHDASELGMSEDGGYQNIKGGETAPPPGLLTVELPVQAPKVAVPVVELMLKGEAGG